MNNLPLSFCLGIHTIACVVSIKWPLGNNPSWQKLRASDIINLSSEHHHLSPLAIQKFEVFSGSVAWDWGGGVWMRDLVMTWLQLSYKALKKWAGDRTEEQSVAITAVGHEQLIVSCSCLSAILHSCSARLLLISGSWTCPSAMPLRNAACTTSWFPMSWRLRQDFLLISKRPWRWYTIQPWYVPRVCACHCICAYACVRVNAWVLACVHRFMFVCLCVCCVHEWMRAFTCLKLA